MKGEVGAALEEEERAREKALEEEERLHGRVIRGRNDEYEERVREMTAWTDCMLVEPGGSSRRGASLRAYVRGRGGCIQHPVWLDIMTYLFQSLNLGEHKR